MRFDTTAYQQAVYLDADNATYWCSIGALYSELKQQRDALDAYSRAIALDGTLIEVLPSFSFCCFCFCRCMRLLTSRVSAYYDVCRRGSISVHCTRAAIKCKMRSVPTIVLTNSTRARRWLPNASSSCRRRPRANPKSPPPTPPRPPTPLNKQQF